MGRGGTDTRFVSFAGAFAVVKRQAELKISEANAGAKTAKRTAAAKRTRRVLAAGVWSLVFHFQFVICTSSTIFTFS